MLVNNHKTCQNELNTEIALSTKSVSFHGKIEIQIEKLSGWWWRGKARGYFGVEGLDGSATHCGKHNINHSPKSLLARYCILSMDIGLPQLDWNFILSASANCGHKTFSGTWNGTRP